MKRAIPWLAAILFLGCLVLGYLAIQQGTEITQVTLHSDSAEKEAQARIVDLQHQLAAAKAAQAMADKQIAQLTAAPAATPVSGAATPPKSGSAGAGGKIIHITDIIKDHPEYAGLYAKQMRRNVDRMYGDGLSTLNLAADQVSQLKGLLAERQMNNIDAQQAAEAAGLERGSPAWQDAMKQASQDVQQQITALLGNNADATLAQLQARAGFQSQVEFTYGPDFTDAGVPLSPMQSSGLIQAMADANYAGKDLSTRPAGYNDPDPTTGLTPHDNRILDSAAQVLSPAQLQVFKNDQIEGRKISAIMKEYNSGGGPVMFVP